MGWIITALAFVGNLFWNFKNRQHTNDLADEIRRDHYRKEVWDRHRSRIEERLEEFVTYIVTLPGQVLALPGEEVASLNIWGVNLNVAHDGLARALGDTDASDYCYGSHWAAKAFGCLTGQETSWDLLLAQFGAAERCRKRLTQVKALEAMKVFALEIEYEVRDEIRQNEYRYQP